MRATKLIHFAILSLSISAFGFFGSNDTKTEQNDIWVEKAEADNADIIKLPSVAPLVKKAEAAVLVVSTESVMENPAPRLPPGFERGPFKDFFRNFGPPQGIPDQKRKGQGSGLIIHPSGLALTNHHVVEGATTIKIKVGSDLVEYDAEVIGSDEATDVALIQIKSDKKDWPVIPLGDSSEMQVGDFAVAIGNPLGLELSASFGMVSARGRNDINPSGKNGLYDFIQIDAPINPGNSGGPLLNLKGEAIGINTAISLSGQGIAFAIPINQVKQILPSLKNTGKATRSWIGVKISNVNSDLAKAMGLKFPHGALISEVVPKSPAAKAGIEPGDIITEFNGETIKDASGLQVKAGLAGVGKKIKLGLIRDSKRINTNLLLEAMPGQDDDPDSGEATKEKPEAKKLEALGLSIQDLDPAARKELGFHENLSGALVSSVLPRSPAAFSGIEAKDVLIKLNGRAVQSAKDFEKGYEKTKEGGFLRVLLKRGKSTIFLVLQKPEGKQK